MISFLEGKVELKDSPYVIINASGVGYKVFVPPNLFATLTSGEKGRLFTYTHVREDLLELYGFSDFSDLKLFELLISVSGVGPKTGIGIFAFGDRSEIVDAILKGNVDFFTKVPRLGRKNAQKIIIELRKKFGEGSDLDLSEGGSEDDEVIMALKGFGFSYQEAKDAVKLLDKKLSDEERIKQALKSMGR